MKLKMAEKALTVVRKCGGVVAWNEQGAPGPHDERGNVIPGPFDCRLPRADELARHIADQDNLFSVMREAVCLADPEGRFSTRWLNSCTMSLAGTTDLRGNPALPLSVEEAARKSLEHDGVEGDDLNDLTFAFNV